jgi:hypothetical protein
MSKVLEHCAGSRLPKAEARVYWSEYNTGSDPLRECPYCGKLLHTSRGKLMAHGRYLTIAGQQSKGEKAYRRAMALCDLHSCGYNRGNRKLTVLAGAYYNEKHKGDEQ